MGNFREQWEEKKLFINVRYFEDFCLIMVCLNVFNNNTV